MHLVCDTQRIRYDNIIRGLYLARYNIVFEMV